MAWTALAAPPLVGCPHNRYTRAVARCVAGGSQHPKAYFLLGCSAHRWPHRRSDVALDTSPDWAAGRRTDMMSDMGAH